MTVEVIDDPAALQALLPEWTALWDATPGATPFQSPHWLLPWWRVFGTAAPRVATWRGQGRLLGVLPAYVLDESGRRKLLPIGAGTTDYLDALGDGAAPMLHALLHRAARDGVPVCDLIELPPGSALHAVPAPEGWQRACRQREACPVLPLPGIPPSMRRNLRLARNRAARAGGLTRHDATPATLHRHLDTLAALHQARWANEGQAGVMADPAVLRFHRLAAPGLLAAGLLRLVVLGIGTTPAAACLALLDRRRIHFYLSGYDPAQRQVSPGTLLFGALLDQAEAEGRDEAHFLRGREPYKYAWGATDRDNITLSFEAGRP